MTTITRLALRQLRALRQLMALAVLAPMALLGTAAPAAAFTADAGVVQGGGAIFPGLTATPQPQLFDFAGAYSPAVLGGGSLAAAGADLAGSYSEGIGVFSVSGACDGSGVFVRVGAVVLASVMLPAGRTANGLFAFIPHGLPPGTINTFDLVGPAYGLC